MSKNREMQVDITKITQPAGAFQCLLALSVGICSSVRNVALTNPAAFMGAEHTTAAVTK
jgi:hypothetical protein